MLIDRIDISLQPAIFPNTPIIELRIRVRSMGQEYNITQALREDDLKTRLELYLEHAVRHLHSELKKQEEAVNA